MKISRAAFLKSCSVAFVGTFIEAAKLPWNPFEAAKGLRLQDATADLFKKHVNDAFDVRATGERPARLILAKVTERPVEKTVAQFSLIFHSAPDCVLPDGTHVFRHESLGNFEMFISAIGIPNDCRRLYQACFSRHVGVMSNVSRAT